jgi:hypothetical protein
MTKCSECGYENMDGLDYCDGCGAKLAHPAEGAPAPDAEAAPTAPAAASSAEPEPEPAPAAAAPEPAPAAAEAPAAEAPAAEAPTGELNKPAAGAAPAPAAAFKARLTVIRGGRKGQEFPLEDGKNLIGRWDPETGSFPEVDLEQDDPEAKISRKHAMIIIENGKLTIEDIGSLNGTYVNRGNRLIPGTPIDLKTGDEIIIGKTFLKLVVDPIS